MYAWFHCSESSKYSHTHTQYSLGKWQRRETWAQTEQQEERRLKCFNYLPDCDDHHHHHHHHLGALSPRWWADTTHHCNDNAPNQDNVRVRAYSMGTLMTHTQASVTWAQLLITLYYQASKCHAIDIRHYISTHTHTHTHWPKKCDNITLRVLCARMAPSLSSVS